MRITKALITGILIFATVSLVESRIVKAWSYQEFYDQSDLVVIAQKFIAEDTTEAAVPPNLSLNVHVVGVSTKFRISGVLKGDRNLTWCILHNYRLANPEAPMIDGPMLVAFDPKVYPRFCYF